MRLQLLQNAIRLSKVVPQARISSEELLQRTGRTHESSNRHWKIYVYTAEGFPSNGSYAPELRETLQLASQVAHLKVVGQ